MGTAEHWPYRLIDVYWTLGVGAVAALGSLAPLSSDRSPSERRIMVAVMVAFGRFVWAAISWCAPVKPATIRVIGS